MPEGPELKREADAMAKAAQGKVLREVYFFAPALKEWEAKLRGRRVLKVRAHGKAMLLELSGGTTLYAHNQLFGKWAVLEPGERPKTNRSIRIHLGVDGADLLLYSASEIRVLDARGVREHPYLSRLGPDLLDDATTPAVVAQRLAEAPWSGRTFSALLLDQSFIAGNGNYLRSEMLFDAKRHWAEKPKDLSAAQRRAVAKSIVEIGRRAYRTGGYTNDEKRIAALRKLGKRSGLRFAVFAREGKPCYRCATPILREVANGRRIYRCPACQPAPEGFSAARSRPRRAAPGSARGAPRARRRRASPSRPAAARRGRRAPRRGNRSRRNRPRN